MAKPGSVADEVKQRSDIVRVVGEYVLLRKAGVNFMGLCPFHSEKTPSFSVHPTRQIFHCFGCGEGGDVFKFVMLVENISFPEALKILAEKVGVRVRTYGGAREADDKDPKVCQRTELYRLHQDAAKFFAEQMSATGEGRAARAYLVDRGLSGPVMARFGLGYAPASGHALERFLGAMRFEPAVLEASGLLLKDVRPGGKLEYVDRFRRRIIFPITNERGKVIAFAGRTLADAETPDGKNNVPKYLNSPETPIYLKSRVLYNLDRVGQPVRKAGEAILVEGYMDCIGLSSAGIEHAVASCGTSLTNAQVRLLGRYARRVVVNFDPDAAGIRATQRSLDLLLEEGFEVRVLELPGGLDPDSFVKREGAEAYRKLLERAPSYVDYLTERAAREHDMGTAEGKVAAVNALLPYLAKIPQRILRAETARRVSERLRVEERLVQEEITRAASDRRPEISTPTQHANAKVTTLEKQLLQILFDDEELRREFATRLTHEPIHRGLASEPVLEQLMKISAEGGQADAAEVRSRLSSEQQRLFTEIFSLPLGRMGRQEAENCWNKIRQNQLESKRKKLQREIEGAERARNGELLTRLIADKSLLNKQLAQMRKM